MHTQRGQWTQEQGKEYNQGCRSHSNCNFVLQMKYGRQNQILTGYRVLAWRLAKWNCVTTIQLRVASTWVCMQLQIICLWVDKRTQCKEICWPWIIFHMFLFVLSLYMYIILKITFPSHWGGIYARTFCIRLTKMLLLCLTLCNKN